MKFPCFQHPCPSSVAVEYYRNIHEAVRHFISQVSSHTACNDFCNNTLSYMINQMGMYIIQRTACKGKVSKSHIPQFIHNKIDYIISVSQMMVKRYCHTIF